MGSNPESASPAALALAPTSLTGTTWLPPCTRSSTSAGSLGPEAALLRRPGRDPLVSSISFLGPTPCPPRVTSTTLSRTWCRRWRRILPDTQHTPPESARPSLLHPAEVPRPRASPGGPLRQILLRLRPGLWNLSPLRSLPLGPLRLAPAKILKQMRFATTLSPN